MCCKKCGMGMSVALLVLGVAFLLKDLGVWNFWGLNWWTAMFLLAAVAMFGTHCCKECCDMRHKKK